MSVGEFTLIERLFKGQGGSPTVFTSLAIGDDASIHQPDPDLDLVVSTDTSVQGIHWPDDFPLDLAAGRAVASALSDLAAMGAEPACAWLNVMAVNGDALTLLGQGATAALCSDDVELAGGDSCRSTVNALSVTVAGQLPKASAMRRDGASAQDNVWLCGRLGLHALGLQQWLSGEKDGSFVPYFKSVSALLEAGVQLRQSGIACCIDISDGLLQDAGHVCQASGIGMEIELSTIPQWYDLCEQLGSQTALQAICCGGEDYALLFTAAADWVAPAGLAIQVGRCCAEQGVRVLLHGIVCDVPEAGFDHFN